MRTIVDCDKGDVSVDETWIPPAPPPPESSDYQRAIDAYIDAAATAKSYASGVSCASYVKSTNVQWASEAETFIAWRDAVWAYAYAELDKVLTGKREAPSVSGFIEELPAIRW